MHEEHVHEPADAAGQAAQTAAGCAARQQQQQEQNSAGHSTACLRLKPRQAPMSAQLASLLRRYSHYGATLSKQVALLVLYQGSMGLATVLRLSCRLAYAVMKQLKSWAGRSKLPGAAAVLLGRQLQRLWQLLCRYVGRPLGSLLTQLVWVQVRLSSDEVLEEGTKLSARLHSAVSLLFGTIRIRTHSCLQLARPSRQPVLAPEFSLSSPCPSPPRRLPAAPATTPPHCSPHRPQDSPQQPRYAQQQHTQENDDGSGDSSSSSSSSARRRQCQRSLVRALSSPMPDVWQQQQQQVDGAGNGGQQQQQGLLGLSQHERASLAHALRISQLGMAAAHGSNGSRRGTAASTSADSEVHVLCSSELRAAILSFLQAHSRVSGSEFVLLRNMASYSSSSSMPATPTLQQQLQQSEQQQQGGVTLEAPALALPGARPAAAAAAVMQPRVSLEADGSNTHQQQHQDQQQQQPPPLAFDAAAAASPCAVAGSEGGLDPDHTAAAAAGLDQSWSGVLKQRQHQLALQQLQAAGIDTCISSSSSAAVSAADNVAAAAAAGCQASQALQQQDSFTTAADKFRSLAAVSAAAAAAAVGTRGSITTRASFGGSSNSSSPAAATAAAAADPCGRPLLSFERGSPPRRSVSSNSRGTVAAAAAVAAMNGGGLAYMQLLPPGSRSSVESLTLRKSGGALSGPLCSGLVGSPQALYNHTQQHPFGSPSSAHPSTTTPITKGGVHTPTPRGVCGASQGGTGGGSAGGQPAGGFAPAAAAAAAVTVSAVGSNSGSNGSSGSGSSGGYGVAAAGKKRLPAAPFLLPATGAECGAAAVNAADAGAPGGAVATGGN